MTERSSCARRVAAFTAAVLMSFGALPLNAQTAPSGQAASTGEQRDPANRAMAIALAEEIVTLGYPEETREEMFFSAMDQTVVQMRAAIEPTLPTNDAGAIAILDEWIVEYLEQSKQVLQTHIPDIMDGMVQAYAEIFTVNELRDIRDFVSTPSGQRYFEMSPSVMSQESFASANQRYLDETMAMLGPAQRELLERLQAYSAQQRTTKAEPDT